MKTVIESRAKRVQVDDDDKFDRLQGFFVSICIQFNSVSF
jgi:hypothetical protein